MKDKNSNKFEASLILSMLVFSLFLFMSAEMGNKVYGKLGGYSNLFLYVLSVLVFCFCFCFSFYMFNKNNKLCVFWENKLKVLSISLCLAWCAFAYFFETKLYPNNAVKYLRHSMPFLLYIILILSALCIFIKSVNLNIILGKWCIRIFCVGLVVMVFALMYAPNLFNDTCNSIYHIHAYTNSVMNVLKNIPYDNVNCSIYGHYGLLYYFPVKLLAIFCQSELAAFILLVAFISCITFAMTLYCLRKLVKNDVVFCMIGVSLLQPITQLMQGQYYQLYPHRIFFPALLVFALIIVKEKKIKHHKLLNWTIVSLGIIWNIEIGLVCAGALFLYNVYEELIVCNMNNKIFHTIFYNLLWFINSFIMSYMLVNFYNLLVGGHTISFRRYIYPIGSSVYSVGDLMLPLPQIYSGYFLVLVVLLSDLIFTLFHGFKLRGKEEISIEIGILFVVALLGLGKITYFMNRTAYGNLSIVHLELMLVLGFFIDKAKFMSMNIKSFFLDIKTLKFKFISNEWSGILGLIAVLISVCICVAGSSYVGIAFRNIADTSWKTQALEEFYGEIEKDIPKDTVAFGQGVPEIWAGMNRQTYLYVTDWSDMNVYSLDAVEQKVNNSDTFFAAIGSITDIKAAEEFKCVKTYTLPGFAAGGGATNYQFGYYVRNEVYPEFILDKLNNAGDTIAANVENVYNVSGVDFKKYWMEIARLYSENEVNKCGEEYIRFLNDKGVVLSDYEFVMSLYRVFLQREPEAVECEEQVGYLNSAGSRSSLVGVYLSSDEFNSLVFSNMK